MKAPLRIVAENTPEQLLAQSAAPLNSGDGGGTFDGMEARVKALEDRFSTIESKLDAIGKDVTSSRIEMAEVKGKISNMPSTWQVVGLTVALAVAVFTFIRFGVGA